MIARVQTFHHSAEKLDELTELTRQQVAAARSIPGLNGYYLLVDRDNGKAVLLSLWSSEEDLRRLEATNASTRERVEAEVGVQPPAAEIFEVALRAAAPSS
ncbi:antibiotic biosynthesis monooxygenase [Cryptosporangium phraense]|uniref:antibiotic biosynthesis monooxygenase n=1 Tax=Cryptosporangium phraense TaxID=2593070 RepID=UPI0014793750|nr:antibiotic biosynthesis monooxygenase [Cryptosporangium phraense]